MAKVIEGVYVQQVENHKVVNKYLSLENVPFRGKQSIGDVILVKEEQIKMFQAQIEQLNKELTGLKIEFVALQEATKKALQVLIDKYESGKIL